jgi:hypothetical protein
MTAGYPFPIPKTIETEVLAKVADAGPPMQDLEDWRETDADPAMFGLLFCWRGRTSMLVDSLKLLLDRMVSVVPRDDFQHKLAWEALCGTTYALEARLVQLNGFLEWARLTWPHDPAVRDMVQAGGTLEVSGDEGGAA